MMMIMISEGCPFSLLLLSRSGSVVTDMTLVFDKQSSVPSSSNAQAILTSSSTSLNIIPGSVSDGTYSSPGADWPSVILGKWPDGLVIII